MRILSRRAAIASLAAATAVAAGPAWSSNGGSRRQPERVFAHGVASGDPRADRVIIWTRVSPRSYEDIVDGQWVVAADRRMRRPCARGRFSTNVISDFTVKIDVDGLEPDHTYYYQFFYRGARSPVGRTRTLPAGRVAAARFAFVSCSNYPYGYFNAYARIAARNDLNFVLHLGDYLYEYPLGEYVNPLLSGMRDVDPADEVVTLTDYRLRYAQYRSDPDLQEVHRQHAFITVWDDHESANDAYRDGAQNHNPERGEGEWIARKHASVRAYNEWMPIRSRGRSDARIFRRFRVGDLCDLLMLDTRLFGRDLQAAFKTGQSELPVTDAVIAEPSRSLLGLEQEQWLEQQLWNSRIRGARWRILGQQTMIAQLSATFGRTIINPDQWDGYGPARTRLYRHLIDNNIPNNVVLSGDIHSSWFNDLTINPWDPSAYDATTGRGVVGVEFVTPAVSSPGPIPDAAAAAATAAQLKFVSPHMKFIDLFRRGYGLIDVNRDRVQGDVYHIASVDARTPGEQFAAGFISAFDSNALRPASGPSAARAQVDAAPTVDAD